MGAAHVLTDDRHGHSGTDHFSPLCARVPSQDGDESMVDNDFVIHKINIIIIVVMLD